MVSVLLPAVRLQWTVQDPYTPWLGRAHLDPFHLSQHSMMIAPPEQLGISQVGRTHAGRSAARRPQNAACKRASEAHAAAI